MDYEEAKKEAEKITNPGNYMVITLGWDKVILPYKEGLILMGALQNAEAFVDNYGDISRILPIDMNKISATTLSIKDYQLIKIAALMGIAVKDLKEQLNKK